MEMDETQESLSPELASELSTALIIELGKRELTLRDLAQLKKGQIIELPSALGDEVSLVVGGKAIGKGTIIEIEGEIGVRINSLLDA